MSYIIPVREETYPVSVAGDKMPEHFRFIFRKRVK